MTPCRVVCSSQTLEQTFTLRLEGTLVSTHQTLRCHKPNLRPLLHYVATRTGWSDRRWSWTGSTTGVGRPRLRVPSVWKSFPATGLERPLGFQEVEAPEFIDNRHMKVVRSSALRTGRLYPQERFLVLISVKRLSRPQGHNTTGRIKPLKNSSDSIGNRTRNLPACSAVPQPTAPPRTLPPVRTVHQIKTQKK
jgi:hypothetical protein